MTRDGTAMSTLDFYGAGWVLLSSSQTWCEPVVHMTERTGIPVGAINLRAVLGQNQAPRSRNAFSGSKTSRRSGG